MLGESKLIAWLAWAEVAVCHSQSWGRTVLPLCHTQPRLPCLSLHTCQVAASTLDECQGVLSKQATLPQLPREPCGNSSWAGRVTESYDFSL